MSAIRPKIHRLFAAGIAIIVAVSVSYFALRVAAAAWRVFPPPLPNPNSPSTDLDLLSSAASLAPGEAVYPYFLATELQRRGRALPDGPERQESLEQADDAIRHAMALLSTNAYYHRVAASIALDRLVYAAPEERPGLLEAARGDMRTAIAYSPASPQVHQQVSLELIRAWPYLDADARALTVSTVRMTAELDLTTLSSLLVSFWAAADLGSDSSLLAAATPDSAAARNDLASVLLDITAATPSSDDVAILQATALAEQSRAVDASGAEYTYVNRWAATYRDLGIASPDEFLAAAQELTTKFPEAPAPWLAVADAERLTGRADEETAAIARAVELARETGGEVQRHANQRHADRSLQAGRYEDALEGYRGLVRLAPDDPYYPMQAGRCLDALGREDEALVAYRRAVRIAPQAVQPREVLAQAYLARDQLLEAIRQWEVLLRRDPDAFEPHVLIARTYAAMGLSDRAVEYYADALELRPADAEIRLELESVLRRDMP